MEYLKLSYLINIICKWAKPPPFQYSISVAKSRQASCSRVLSLSTIIASRTGQAL
jgi:hypothetical protein